MADRKSDEKRGTDTPALPKKVDGVKLPKDVRAKLTGLAKHPAVAALLAAGVTALAARLTTEPAVKKRVSKAAAATEGLPATVAETASDAAEVVAKPVSKRTRKPVSEADPVGAAAPAAPARRTRKPAAESVSGDTAASKRPRKAAPPAEPTPEAVPAPAPKAPPRRTRKSAAATGASAPAKRPRKAADSASTTAKPRAARRTTPKPPSKPKSPETAE